MELAGVQQAKMVMPGVLALQLPAFTNYANAQQEMAALNEQLKNIDQHVKRVDGLHEEMFMIVVCDDASFVSRQLGNFLWAGFTRCNPSHDIYGINSFVENKHWGCKGPVIIDARIKPHHAPPVEKDPAVEKQIEYLFNKGGSLYQKLA